MPDKISKYWRYELAERDHQEFYDGLREQRKATPVWPVWHRACGDIAFFLTHHPFKDSIKSDNVRLFNGRRPPYKSEMICESCNRKIVGAGQLLAEMPQRPTIIQLGETPWHKNVNVQ